VKLPSWRTTKRQIQLEQEIKSHLQMAVTDRVDRGAVVGASLRVAMNTRALRRSLGHGQMLPSAAVADGPRVVLRCRCLGVTRGGTEASEVR